MSDEDESILKVLIVDDEPLVQDVLKRLLVEEGFEVDTRGTFAEGEATLASDKYDLAILDKVLPDGDGMKLAQQLDNLDSDCEVAIITGYASMDSAIEAMRIRVADYLIKPVKIKQVRDRVQRMAEHLRLKRRHNRLLKELDNKSQAVEKLKAQATRDPLTGLFNHAYFQDQLTNELARCKRYQHEAGLLFLDVDNFKNINDSLGHQKGDKVLQSIADILKGSSRNVDVHFRLREHDIAARYGGDEFVLLLPETDKVGSSITAERLRRSVEKYNFEIDFPARVTLSIGVAAFRKDAEERDGLIASADIALYAAKQSGRNRVIAYTPDLASVGTQHGYETVIDIRRVAALDELLRGSAIDFAFQPIVDAKKLEPFGYEAFCRPGSDLFPTPIELIVAAERAGKLGELGRFLRERAIDKISELPEACALFVNLHPQELNDPELMRSDSPLLDVADRLVLEINNSRQISDQSRLKKVIVKLRERGFRIALDDICTGYLGLNSLVRLEPDFVKLDTSMLQAFSKEGRSSRLIRHYLDYTAGENILVIASGIETEEQRQMATYLGCPLLQGFYFAEASPDFELIGVKNS